MIKHRTPAPTRRRSAGGLTAYTRRVLVGPDVVTNELLLHSLAGGVLGLLADLFDVGRGGLCFTGNDEIVILELLADFCFQLAFGMFAGINKFLCDSHDYS